MRTVADTADKYLFYDVLDHLHLENVMVKDAPTYVQDKNYSL